MYKNSCRESAFTLIELVIAASLLLLILFSLGLIFPLLVKKARHTSHHDQAVALADGTMEKIRSLQWQNIAKNDRNAGIAEVIYSGLNNDPRYKASYPPLPYPRIDYQFLYPGTGAQGDITHHIRYYLIVRSQYDPDYTTEDLIRLKVEVHWTEASTSGSPHQKSIAISSKIYNWR